MRYLHPVAAHEKYIGSGKYVREVGGQPSRYEESWTIHELQGGARLIRIDQDARFSDGWSKLAEVLRSPNGRIERINVQIAQQASQAGYRVMKTDYTFLDDYAQISRTIDKAERQYAEVATPANTYIRLLDFALFWGEALTIAHQQDCSQLPVFVPIFKPKLDPARVVMGAMPQVTAVAEETLTRGDKQLAATRYTTKGDRRVWLDARQIPLRLMEARTQTLDTLTDYAHR